MQPPSSPAPRQVRLLACLLHGSKTEREAAAQRLLQEHGSLWALGTLTKRELLGDGLSKAAATRLRAALVLGAKASVAPVHLTALTSPEEAVVYVAPLLVVCRRERMVTVVLDAKNRPRRIAVVAEGTSDCCPVDTREVFRLALRTGGSAIIVAHNHPSGDPSPSAEDVALTARLVAAGDLLGMPLLDHLIIGATASTPRFVSMAASGALHENRGHQRRTRGTKAYKPPR